MENLQKKIHILVGLYKKNDLVKAEKLANDLIRYNPNIALLYNLLGLILTSLQKLDEAINTFDKGLKINPEYAEIYNNLGNIYKAKENFIYAEDYYKKSIKLKKNTHEPLNNLASLYLQKNQYDKAIKYFKKSLNKNPNFFIASFNLGSAYISLGKYKKAKKYLERTIKISPHFYSAHRALSLIVKYKKKNKHFQFLKEVYENTKIDQSYKSEIGFALGKASDDMKDYSMASKFFIDANKIRRKNIEFTLLNEIKLFNNIKKKFNKDLFTNYKEEGCFDMSPIFIIGMPRSGTTLVEQIISTHTKVFGCGELNILPNLINKYFYKNNEINFTFDNINPKKIGEEYLYKLKLLNNKKEKFTDKMPINFKYVGLIKIILPKAKIIHCNRNARDTCLSIFKNYFSNPDLNYAYNLDEIIEYYKLYENLMIYWKSILPNIIYDINYEKLVNSPNQQIKNLIKACDLKWQDRCLKFYNNKRAITTASDTQVRNKIYKKSINSWKSYESTLNNFFDKI